MSIAPEDVSRLMQLDRARQQAVGVSAGLGGNPGRSASHDGEEDGQAEHREFEASMKYSRRGGPNGRRASRPSPPFWLNKTRGATVRSPPVVNPRNVR